MNDLTNDGNDVFVADPDAFDDDFDIEPPGWTKPVGVISIIWGVIGVLCNGLGVGSAFLMPSMMQSAAGNLEGGMPDVLLQVNPIQIVMSVFGFIMSIVNIVAGVLIVGRNPSGRIVHLVWSILAILSLVVAAKVQLDIQGDIAQWAQDNPDSDFAAQQQAGGPVGRIIGVLILLVFLIWPAFCLFWFGVVKRTAKDITGGIEMPAA